MLLLSCFPSGIYLSRCDQQGKCFPKVLHGEHSFQPRKVVKYDMAQIRVFILVSKNKPIMWTSEYWNVLEK